MTCIVAVKDKKNNKVVLAGERGASDDSTIIQLATPKIFKVGKYLIGYAGSMSGEKLKYAFKPTDFKAGANIDQHMNTVFLKELRDCYDIYSIPYMSNDADLSLIVVADGQMYQHHASDMSMTKPSEDYLAIGSGADYAYGSFWSTEKFSSVKTRAELAVSAAVKFSTTCSGEVDVLIG